MELYVYFLQLYIALGVLGGVVFQLLRSKK